MVFKTSKKPDDATVTTGKTTSLVESVSLADVDVVVPVSSVQNMFHLLLLHSAWVDVVIVGGREYHSMLLYRARVLSSRIERMIVAQQLESFSGTEAQSAVLNLAALRAHVPVTLLRWKATKALHWHREWALRSRLVTYLKLNVKNKTVLVSDVDEIPDAVPRHMTALDSCHRLRLRFSYYSPLCNFGVWGHGGVMIHTASREFAAWTAAKKQSEALNALVRGAACQSPPGFFGWHLSYAMDTESIRRKLRSFSHSRDGFVRTALRQNDSYFDTAASTCTDLFLRNTVHGSCSTKHLPPPGWPSHPAAPSTCS